MDIFHQVNTIISFKSLLTPFFRFVTTEYLKEKLSTGFSDDLGIGIFLCVIIFTVHAAGCAAKFIMRKMKPSEPKILLLPKRAEAETETEIEEIFDEKANEINDFDV